MEDLAQFRTEVQSFYATLPDLLSGLDDPLERGRAYLAARYDAGLGALDYPIETGGRGLDKEFINTFREEAPSRESANAVFGFGIGINMALPTLRDYGSTELQQRFLRPGLRGDEIWCQLYSEPGAGSDLAGLTTSAKLDGDQWVVSGQKVWTSGASDADFGILLARTNPDVPKHQGISMMILPMKQPGVEVRPLHQMTGVSSFNEVFITEAKIPAPWVVGAPGEGWRMAVALLSYERSSIGAGGGRRPITVERLISLAQESEAHQDPIVRQDLATLFTNRKIIGWLNRRPGIHPSLTKLWRTKEGRAAAATATRLAHMQVIAWEGKPLGNDKKTLAYGICDAPALSLGGGTDEVQRNTLGERVLGLPREPTPDRNLAFKDTLKN